MRYLDEYVQLRFGLKDEEKEEGMPEFKVENLVSRRERQILAWVESDILEIKKDQATKEYIKELQR